jgi:copper(I)-binding protein
MFVRQVLACLVAAFVASPAAAADAPPLLELSKAWTPAAGRTGADVPLYVTIANHGSEPDSLLRVRCPVDPHSC